MYITNKYNYMQTFLSTHEEVVRLNYMKAINKQTNKHKYWSDSLISFKPIKKIKAFNLGRKPKP